jgi:hypothetical protein
MACIRYATGGAEQARQSVQIAMNTLSMCMQKASPQYDGEDAPLDAILWRKSRN